MNTTHREHAVIDLVTDTDDSLTSSSSSVSLNMDSSIFRKKHQNHWNKESKISDQQRFGREAIIAVVGR